MGDKDKDNQPRTSREILKPFHASIAQWRGDGAKFREIAERLRNAAGLNVNYTAIYRYCEEENLHPEPKKKVPPTRNDILTKPSKRPPSAIGMAQTNADEATEEGAQTEPESESLFEDDAGERAEHSTTDLAGDTAEVEVSDDREPELSEPEETTSDEQGLDEREPVKEPKKPRANKPLTPDVRNTSSANKTTSEQASNEREQGAKEPEQEARDSEPEEPSVQGRQPWETYEAPDKPIAETPPPSAAPTVVEPLQARGESISEYLEREMPKLKALATTPSAFLESIARITRWIEDAAQKAPPEQEMMYRESLEAIKAWSAEHSPERIKQRSLLERFRYWLMWKVRAAQYQQELAASGEGNQPSQPSTQPPINPQPTRSVPYSAPAKELFVPLESVPAWTPNLELVGFNGGVDRFTLADATEGVAIFGSTGSGKTSGSGRTLACSYLNSGFGGLVLTAKVDEAQLWQQYAELTGRTQQLCVVRPGGPFRFNFLDYQTNLPESQGGSVENVTELLVAILDAYAKTKPRTSVDTFWENTARQLLRNLLRIFRGAQEPVTLDKLRVFIGEAPLEAKELEGGVYKPDSLFTRLLTTSAQKSRGKRNAGEIDEAIRFWTWDFPRLNGKTRSIVITHLTSMIDLFFDPQVWELFCGETTLTPDAVFQGAVIVVDLPIERYQSIGRIAAIIFKHFFQLAVPRRSDPSGSSRRPVFLWVDEAQYFMTEHDSVFQATARGAKAATVYLTQNISNCYAQAGGDRHRVDGFFSNLNTKIFHSNNDPTTNHWAAEMIGKAMKYRASVTTQDDSEPWRFSWKSLLSAKPKSSVTTSPQMDYEVEPADFGKLRTGGIHPNHPQDNLHVDAFLVKSGARFSNGKHFFKATFLQG